MQRAFEKGSFRWGVCIDDMWIYAGLQAPKSIIIPHLLAVRLPQGPFSMNFGQTSRAPRNEPELSTTSLFDLPDSKKKLLTRIFSRNLAIHLKKNKIGFVRCWFQWNIFQPKINSGKKQEYQFPLDSFVKALNHEGIDIIAVVGNGYYRFLPRGLEIDYPEIYLARLAEASMEIVRHYKGRISMWQLENEPNWWLEHFASDWRRGGIWFEKDMADLILDMLHRIVSEEDPNTPKMINLEADRAEVSTKYARYCDVLGLDFYPNYARATPIRVSEIRKKVSDAKSSTGKPIMIAETGYPSGPRIFGYNVQNQSQYVKLITEEAYSNDAIRGLGMWRLSDGYWLSFPFQENNFGLLDFRGIPKPAWFEYINQIRNRD